VSGCAILKCGPGAASALRAPAEAIAARENTGGFIQDKDKLSQEV
jgi:hypothetical protein